jgi:hypothetical protein
MVKGMTLESDVFTLTGKGTMAHSGELSMDATIAFTPEFSAALVSSAKDLKKILAADGRLTIPLTIAGHPPLVVVVPNLREVISLAAERVVTDKAKDILNKALGKNFGF